MPEKKYAKITDEMLARLRSTIGVERPYRNQWHEEATRDAIRHWAWGIGDPNPLWWREEYARTTRYGGIIAPPTFPYSCNCGPLWYPEDKGSRGARLPGIHSLWSGDAWNFHKPVFIDDRVKAVSKLIDVIEKGSAYVGRMFQQLQEVSFTNQKGERVSRYIMHNMSYERGKPREKGKYSDIKRYRYTEEELQAIEADYDREELRGATPRYWEDVAEGDSIGHVVKGPLTVTSLITFFQGWGGHFCMTDRIVQLYLRAHPAAGIRDQSNVPDVPPRGHWDPDFAADLGFPTGYDVGGQRISWYGHLMTNWMGDDGWLKSLSVELRRPNFLGDTTWIRGKITRKYLENGENLVECELTGDNQRGERNSQGVATAALPSRG
ncbi:MAG: MaoC family dehydratase N-terminal domain-containing protein [Chloroflexi bacterium]|nr:MaoC family dehydratase N-terminal domain-containing protein [Chloroflexota bacterium]